ncbi:MAG: hypothetical protein KIPDCIKN_01812 [Haliscomenobacter sp.]|nr:hypothetical protein [Haliscomenobacter sp.]
MNIEIKDVITVAIALSGYAIAFWQIFIKRRHDKADKKLAIRREAYGKFMTKHQQIMSDVLSKFNEMINLTNDFYLLENSGERQAADEKFKELAIHQIDIYKNMSLKFNELAQELNLLSFDATDNVMIMCGEYAQKLIGVSEEIAKRFKTAPPQPDLLRSLNQVVHTGTLAEVQKYGGAILLQMRKDLTI